MSSKRGRPARQMNEEKIINFLMDYYYNTDYFTKLFDHNFITYDEERSFVSFFKKFHAKLSESTVSKTNFLESSASINKTIERYIEIGRSKLEIQERHEEMNDSLAKLSENDIAEFQSVVDEIPDEIWSRYNSRLRQKAYKKNKGRYSRQIEFSEDAYFELSFLKNYKNSKSWNEFAIELAHEHKRIQHLCKMLQVNNLDAALVKVNEMLLLQR